MDMQEVTMYWSTCKVCGWETAKRHARVLAKEEMISHEKASHPVWRDGLGSPGRR